MSAALAKLTFDTIFIQMIHKYALFIECNVTLKTYAHVHTQTSLISFYLICLSKERAYGILLSNTADH